MKIIGRGLTAMALAHYQHELDDVVVFASGVADSRIIDPAEFEREYALLYETLNAALKAGQRVVYFSSGGTVYGPTTGPRSESTPAFPTTPYGRHKLLCEAIVRQSTLPYLIVRLPNLVGAPQNKTQLIPALIHQMRRGEATIFADASRDLLDVADFAAILVRLLRHVTHSETVVVASERSVPVPELFEFLRQTLGVETHVTWLPRGDAQVFDISHLRSLLGEPLDFALDYYKTVILKYAGVLADTLP